MATETDDSNAEALAVRFREAMGQVAAPVCVVTTMHEGGAHGTTVSAFMSLSMTPPMLLLSLDNSSRLLGHITLRTRLGVNVLATGQHELAMRFAGKSAAKFEGVEWELDGGVPRLAGVHAWVALDVEQLVPAGDHKVVLGEVAAAEACDGFLPLTYHLRQFGTHAAL
jgi:flavin reductase (DIM6/NTAB) family NADH-FMN oxidoreductase RutF